MTVFPHLGRALPTGRRVGVLHVGAHVGAMVPFYRRAGFERITCVEPNPDVLGDLRRRRGVDVVWAAVSDQPGPLLLHVPEDSRKASLLAPLAWPEVRSVEVPVVALADLEAGHNVAVVHAQGHSLAVLRSGTLEPFDALIVKVTARADRYEGGCTRKEIVGYLAGKGWRSVSTWPYSNRDVADVVFAR